MFVEPAGVVSESLAPLLRSRGYPRPACAGNARRQLHEEVSPNEPEDGPALPPARTDRSGELLNNTDSREARKRSVPHTVQRFHFRKAQSNLLSGG